MYAAIIIYIREDIGWIERINSSPVKKLLLVVHLVDIFHKHV